MASLPRRFRRGYVVATTTVIMAAGLLLAATRMVFSHLAESAEEPGTVLTTTPRVASSRSPATATQGSTVDGDASSTQYEPGGSAVDSWTSSDSSTRGHVPQAAKPDPPVAVDHGHRQPAPATPAVPAKTAASTALGRIEMDNGDDDKKPARNGVKEPDSDDRNIDD